MVLVGHLGEVALALEAARVLAGAVQAEHERDAPARAQPLGHVDDDRGRPREDVQAVVACARDDRARVADGACGRAGRAAGGAGEDRVVAPAPPHEATVSATSTTTAHPRIAGDATARPVRPS